MVIIRLAILPTVILPCESEIPIANAPLIVAAFMASSGVIFILIHAVATTKFMFPDGVEPGLKSVAKVSFMPMAFDEFYKVPSGTTDILTTEFIP